MKYLLPLLIFVGFLQPAFAQQSGGVIKGTVTDSAKVQPLEFVTLGLREAGKQSFFKSTVTDEKGNFRFAGLAFQSYELVISYVGYQSELIKITTLSAQNPEVTLPAIRLKTGASRLKEVEISTQKMLVTQDLDKISYDVEADPESNSETVLEMLRKVPQVTVDADDNIKLKGNSSFRVLINGKTSALFAQNPKEVLKNMPASSIKRIEVITNPPAKYDAEGIGGLINIVTHKNNPGGYNGSINAGGRLPRGYFGNVYFTAKTGKLGVDVNCGRNNWLSPNGTSSFIRREASGRQLSQTGSSTNSGRYQYGNVSMSFELDSLNLFTSGYSFYGGWSDPKNGLLVRLDSMRVPVQQYKQTSFGNNNWSGHDLSLDYQRSFRKNADQLLTFSYKFSSNDEGALFSVLTVPELEFLAYSTENKNQHQEMEHTAQADYVQPFGPHSWEAGLKNIRRLNTSSFYFSTLGPLSDVSYNDPAFTDDFDYHQNIHAGYTSLKIDLDPWSFRVGARLEETSINAAFKSSELKITDRYFNPVPSVAISRKLTETQDVKFAFSQRLERPGLWYLNPYVNQVDPKNISFGNPTLDATVSQVFELNYSAFIKSSMINLSGSYDFTNNAIQSITTLRGDTAFTTYKNTGKNRTATLNINGNLNLVKKLSLNLNSSVAYQNLTGTVQGQSVSNSGITGSLFLNGGYKFEKNWRINGNVGFISPGVMLQGQGGGYFNSGITFSKYFLKDNKANINLSVSNPFQRTRRWINEIDDARFYQRQESEVVIRRVGIAFTYRFGALKEGIAKKKRGIENDDVKSGKSGAGN